MALPPGATLISGGDNNPPAPRSWLDSASDFAKEWWNQVNPVSAIKGVDQAFYHPIDTAATVLQNQGDVEKKAKAAFDRGDYAQGIRHFLNYMLPVLGPQTDAAGDMMQNGQYAKGAGMTAGIATNVAAPEIAGAAADAIPSAVITKPLLLGRTPEAAYESALKPSTTLNPAERARIVNTGLEQGIPVSKAGIETLASKIDDLNQKITAQIQADPTRPISPTAVAARTQGLENKFANQVNPDADLAAIADSRDEFLRNRSTSPLPPGAQGPKNLAPINAEDAQAMKTGTYRQLDSKAYGELQSASIESQKALARGLKEELAMAFPELSNLNGAESELLDLQPSLERAVNRISNHQLLGIGTPVAAGAAKAVTGSNKLAAVAGVMKAALDDPIVKSRLAIAVHRGSGIPLDAANARVAAYADQFGALVGKQGEPADQSQP
jgi:hypothetical protein